MEREQEEAQYLDLFGVIRESINIVASWGTIFSKITFFHILPLSIIFLSHLWISQWLFGEILYDEDRLLFTRVGTPTYNDLRGLILNEEVLFFLFTILYYIFVIIFSLVSTSAVVYTIACIYTGKDLTFKKLMRVVPKVWQRLMVTFIWSSFIVFAYNMMPCLVFASLVALGEIIDWWEQWGNIYVYGILCFTLVVLILFGLVSHTIIYFVCKSYHQETIDKPALADHLEEYAGEYMPLIDKDIQLGAIQA